MKLSKIDKYMDKIREASGEKKNYNDRKENND